LVGVYLACFRDYSAVLGPGERGVVMALAADRRQARTVLRYIEGLIDDVPLLAPMVQARTKESIDLNNRISIEVHTANFRSVRGYTIVACVCDELAFWRSDDSANPDTEILNSVRPGMATVPGSLLLGISSPYARRGELWKAYERHYGKDSPVLVWKADTRSMNPAVPTEVIKRAYEEDSVAASAEYGAEFRKDIESFVSREAVEAVTVPDRRELPFLSGTEYVAFVDPSGGSNDSMTLAIAHRAGEMAVLDALREIRPPFSPEGAVAEFCDLVRLYSVKQVWGDRYAGEWPREQFWKHGVQYRLAESPKSDLYRDFLPMVNSRKVELLELPRLLSQLLGLERRTSRAGKDSIDHAPGGHDDVVNAAAGALVTVVGRASTKAVVLPFRI
jgi:hypothetical protein